MAVTLGYALSCEEHGPNDLVRYARAAEEAGFEFAMISDHFHPWIERQGHSPFVWSVLGAIAATTERLRIGTGVTCPLIRIHPAIVAQAAATMETLMPGRFMLGLGTGENLNEHITGDRWPSATERRAMLEEAIEVIRDLWRGELTDHHGEHYRVVDAKLYTLPDELPPILDYLEKVVPESGWLVGGRITLADIAVATGFANLRHLGIHVDAASHPKTAAYVDKLLARPSFAGWVERETQFLERSAA